MSGAPSPFVEPPDEVPGGVDHGAFQSAIERYVAPWRDRALRAEAKAARLQQIIDRYGDTQAQREASA